MQLKLSGNMIDVEKGWDSLSAMTVRVGGQLVPRGVEINDESGRQVRLTRCVCNLDRFGAFCCEKGFEIIFIAGNQLHVQSKVENAFKCDQCDQSCNVKETDNVNVMIDAVKDNDEKEDKGLLG